jgi:hypothetical protein
MGGLGIIQQISLAFAFHCAASSFLFYSNLSIGNWAMVDEWQWEQVNV